MTPHAAETVAIIVVSVGHSLVNESLRGGSAGVSWTLLTPLSGEDQRGACPEFLTFPDAGKLSHSTADIKDIQRKHKPSGRIHQYNANEEI